MKKGFDRLRGVAAASAMGLGLLGAGSGRAATVTTRTSTSATVAHLITTATAGSAGSGAVTWGGGSIAIGNNIQSSSSVTSTLGGFQVSASQPAFGIGDAHMTALSWSGPTNPLTTGGLPATDVIGGYLSFPYSTSSTSLADAFDNALTLGMGTGVNSALFVNPTNIVDLTGDTLTTGTMVDMIPGVDVQIQLHFPQTRAVARALYSLTNTTASPITTNAIVRGNLGSNISTTIQDSSDGDILNENTDLWVVSNDATVGFGPARGADPVITTTRYGTGAGVVPTNSVVLGSGALLGKEDNYAHRYDFTIAAGATVRILVFHELTATNALASAGAPDFETLTAINAAGLLTDITAGQQSEIVNYFVDDDADGVTNYLDAFPNDPTETVDTDDDGVGDNADVFPNDATETVDTDGDGVGDNADAFPNDATETVDTDGDGVGDNADAFPNDATLSVAASSSGAVGTTGLLALFGLPVLLRRRKNKIG